MNVYGIEIEQEEGFRVLAKLLHIDARALELGYLLRAEAVKMPVQELLKKELEYMDPQIFLCLMMGKDIPSRKICFQAEIEQERFSL